jgi:hypothetical protein
MTTVKEYVANKDFTVEGNVIRNVPILGTISKNGRIYPKSVRQSAIALFEGREIFKNHTSDRENWTERNYDDLIARVINVHNEDDALRGDLVVSEGHLTGKRLLDDCRAGLSFGGVSGEFEICYDQQELRKGKYVVSNINKVRLLALVPMPATLALHESMEEALAEQTAEQMAHAALHAAIDAVLVGEGTNEEKLKELTLKFGQFLEIIDCPDCSKEGIEEIKALEERVAKLEQATVVTEKVQEPVVQSPPPPAFNPQPNVDWIKKIRS